MGPTTGGAAGALLRGLSSPSARMPRVDVDLKLDFKDVLFRPKRSSLKSRSEVGAALPPPAAIWPRCGGVGGVGRLPLIT